MLILDKTSQDNLCLDVIQSMYESFHNKTGSKR
jgi:hypothetical protein